MQPPPVPRDPQITVFGPASWNRIVVVDELPAPVPHMAFARNWFDTVGGTSAGKALHLAGLGRRVRLDALLGPDAAGAHIASALSRAGLEVRTHVAARSEQHLNLMTPGGERVSLYLATPDDPSASATDASLLDGVDLAVLDLAVRSAELIPAARRLGTPIWTDLHDYDGRSSFHEPFLAAATAVFMNADAVEDPWSLLEGCIAAGPRLAICTLGAEGAIALDAEGARFRTPAAPARIVDTNGAGDAFFSGFLDAWLASPGDVDAALAGGAKHAPIALGSVHLHPSLGA